MLCADRRLEIERRTHALRREIFDHPLLWPDRKPRGVEVIDPELAAYVLGAELEYRDNLALPLAGIDSKTAGLLFRKQGRILVARCFGPLVARFTAAHEVGHWIYHETERVLHRDLPIKGLEQPESDPIEREANYFAACFLMPRKYVADQFAERFRCDGALIVDHAVVHRLRTYAPDSLLYPDQNSVVREKIFARATSYGGRPFVSLAEMFKVSPETMAIRIKELGLIRD